MARNPLEQRLKEYADPLRGPHGSASWQPNLDWWSSVATSHSNQGERASDGKMKLHSTGKKVVTRDTSMQPKVSRAVDKLMAGKGDLNYSGSYLPNVRRGG